MKHFGRLFAALTAGALLAPAAAFVGATLTVAQCESAWNDSDTGDSCTMSSIETRLASTRILAANCRINLGDADDDRTNATSANEPVGYIDDRDNCGGSLKVNRCQQFVGAGRMKRTLLSGGFAVALALSAGPAAAQGTGTESTTTYTYEECKTASLNSPAASDSCTLSIQAPTETTPGPDREVSASCRCTAGAH